MVANTLFFGFQRQGNGKSRDMMNRSPTRSFTYPNGKAVYRVAVFLRSFVDFRSSCSGFARVSLLYPRILKSSATLAQASFR